MPQAFWSEEQLLFSLSCGKIKEEAWRLSTSTRAALARILPVPICTSYDKRACANPGQRLHCKTASPTPPAWDCNQLVLTLKCRIRPTTCSQDGNEMIQPQQPATQGDRPSPPHTCPFLLANPNPVRARGQWAGTLSLATASGLHSGDPAATPHGLGKPSGSSVTASTFPWLLGLHPTTAREDGARVKSRKRKISHLCIWGRSFLLWNELSSGAGEPPPPVPP